jgi:signal transduction histidine kinase
LPGGCSVVTTRGRDVSWTRSTVLREGFTDVLRHSRATRCTVAASADADGVVVRIGNDGVTGAPPDPVRGRKWPHPAGGRGLANLAASIAALGGRVTLSAGDGTFELTARIPLPAGDSARPGVEDRLAAHDPAHSADEVAARDTP